MTCSSEHFVTRIPDTTSPTAPFGIVQLADGTDEGWGCNVRQMHWAESGNYGVVPNPAFPHAFVAAGHDLGEPWDDGCKKAPHWCCTCMNATARDPACAVSSITLAAIRAGRSKGSKENPAGRSAWIPPRRRLPGTVTSPSSRG